MQRGPEGDEPVDCGHDGGDAGHTFATDNDDIQVAVDDAELLEEGQMEQITAHLETITKLHLSCVIYGLQLVVTDGLKGVKFKTSILSNASKLTTLFHTRTNFNAKFLEKFHKTIPSPAKCKHMMEQYLFAA